MDDPTLLEQLSALLNRLLTTAWKQPDWFIFALDLVKPALFAIFSGTALRWLLPRLRSSQPVTPIDPSFPFEVIKPRNDGVLKTLMGADQADDDPLADFNVPYQQRQSDVLAQEQLDGLLDVHRWLLILGRTGLGKTREAAELAQRLSSEGWIVLKMKNAEQLVVPTKFPVAMVGEQPRLLFFLDNLNQAMALGNMAIERATGEALPSALKHPLQKRLKETLEFFEQSCGVDRVRVIATARNEILPEKDGQSSQWDKLAVDRYPAFWKQFHHHELPVPEDEAVAAMLAETTQQANLPSVAEDFIAIARRNDGTFRNVVENLERAKNQRLTVSTATYKDTLRGTWQSRYQAALKSDPDAKNIYDAVDLLRQFNVELDALTVLPTAALLAQCTKPWHIGQRYTLRRSLHQLNETERILQPRDGQIEAKGYAIDAGKYLEQIGKLLLKLAKQYPGLLENSLFSFAVTITKSEHYWEAFQVNTQLASRHPNREELWFIQGFLKGKLGDSSGAVACYANALAIKPNYYEALYNMGLELANLGQYEAAIVVYDQVLLIKPDHHEAFNNQGVLLDEIGQYKAAIAAYNKALIIKPDKYESFNNKGVTLGKLGQHEVAITAYDKALAIKPDYHEALNNKGTALRHLGQYGAAVMAYDKALAIKPDYHEALNNKGVLLVSLGQYEEAIAAYEQALVIKPDNPDCWVNRSIAFLHVKQISSAIEGCRKALEIDPDHAGSTYNMACCHGLQGDVENTVDCLQRAINLDPKYRAMAKTDTDFEPIRQDERFRALVEGESLPDDYTGAKDTPNA